MIEHVKLDVRGVHMYAEGSGRTCVFSGPLADVDLRGAEIVAPGALGVYTGAFDDCQPIIAVDGAHRSVRIADCSILAGADERVWLRYVKWRERWRSLLRWLRLRP